jgi:hypothetical protein
MNKLFDHVQFKDVPLYTEYTGNFDDLDAIVTKVNDWWNAINFKGPEIKDFETLRSYILYLPIDKEALSYDQRYYLFSVATACSFWLWRESDQVKSIKNFERTRFAAHSLFTDVKGV